MEKMEDMKMTMVNKTALYILIAIGVGIVWNIIGYHIEKSFRGNVMSKKKMYCYEQYHDSVVNPVLYTDYLKDADSLVAYYHNIENGNLTPKITFPFSMLPYDTCVYVMGYERDSLIVDVICYYDWGNTGSYRRGYVYRNTLHSNPAPKNRY
ncbi:MAG: hypothetical protein ACOYOT_03250 [Bacteroidales bacterium]